MQSIINNFFSQNNVGLLWDIISDEYQLQQHAKSKTVQNYTQGIRNIFNAQLEKFKTEYPQTQDLLTWNKTFLFKLNTAIQNYYPEIRDYLNKTKIQIIEDDKSPLTSTTIQQISQFNPNPNLNLNPNPILHQDIQSQRRQQFNNQLQEQQDNFNSMMHTTAPPPDIDFTDKNTNQFNTDTDTDSAETIAEQFARTLAERKYDPVPSSLARQKTENPKADTQPELKLKPRKNKLHQEKTATINENHNQVIEYDVLKEEKEETEEKEITEKNKNNNIIPNDANENILFNLLQMMQQMTKEIQTIHEKIDNIDQKIDGLTNKKIKNK